MTRILFVCAAGPSVGGGHVMRSLTLARALEARGAVSAFRAIAGSRRGAGRFRTRTWRARTPTTTFDAVVFDSYALSADEHRAVAKGRPTLVIDDLADRPLAADIVLDAGPARKADDYAGLVPAGAKLLLGPNYAPVRPAFAGPARGGAGAARASGSCAAHPGLAGPDRCGRDHPADRGQAALRFAVGGDDPGCRARERRRAQPTGAPRLGGGGSASRRCTSTPRTCRELVFEVDLAIGAGGSTTWERCVLALPALTLILADNQIAAARALEAAGATPCLAIDAPDFDAAFTHAVQDLLASADRRAALSTASAAVCDGQGADRVAAIFLATL
jgi:UDP-2,4-diacetamido-2,4,6-trideoxy-beta-L-altropyranose hydrolase